MFVHFNVKMIKPLIFLFLSVYQNFLFDPEGHIKLSDFGLA